MAIHLGCYWNKREERGDACAERAALYLRRLAACDPTFAQVSVSYKPSKLRRLASTDFETLERLLEDKTVDGWGYRIAFISGHENRDERWSIHVRCGASPRKAADGWANFCMSLLPRKGPCLKALAQPSALACLMHAMVEAWDPDWAVVYDDATLDDLYREVGMPRCSRGRIFAGWMTYFGRRIGSVPEDLPVYSRKELVQGTLLTLTENPVSVEGADHIATAREIFRKLQRAGLIAV